MSPSPRRLSLLVLSLLVLLVVAPKAASVDVATLVGLRLGCAVYHEGRQSLEAMATRHNHPRDLVPIYSLLGVSLEQRFQGGPDEAFWAIEELVVFGGLEQLVALPLGGLVLGYRGREGLRLAAGPMVDFDHIGAVFIAGWTLPVGAWSVPVELVVIPGLGYRSPISALWVGFDGKARVR